MSKSPEIIAEYRPNNVFPILFPSITPRKIEMMEKVPIEIDVKRGGTPVNPAPKPIAKQLIARTTPRKKASFQVMFFVWSNFGSIGWRVVLFRLTPPVKSEGEVKITQKPRPITKEPPTKLAFDCEK